MGRMKEMAYPESAGWKEPTTSRDAAMAIAPRSRMLRERVHIAIALSGRSGLTADECAARIGETVLATRPRLSELLRMGKIERTGERRLNQSRVKAAVWRAK